jgi:hypothetical protein
MTGEAACKSSASWNGALVEAKPILCSRCKTNNDFQILYYLNADVASDYQNMLRRAVTGLFVCRSCGNEIGIRSPLILDFPRRDLLVFATPRGDDEGVESDFKTFLQKLLPHLPDEVAKRAMEKPYTFVEGATGAQALVKCFEGETLEERNGNTNSDSSLESIQVLNGYQYGALFFYFPAQLPVQELVAMALGAACDLERAGRAKDATRFLIHLAETIGSSHPWLAQETGRLLLLAGDASARDWLQRARIYKHCWIAVTRTYLDATPRRRAEGDTQAPELPHALGADQLRDVSRNRHTVTGMFPGFKDVGLWCFPRMAAASISQEYTAERILLGMALGLGTIDRLTTERARSAGISEPTQVYWHTIQTKVRATLGESPRAPQFWDAYVLANWRLDLEEVVTRISSSESSEDISTSIGPCRSTLAKISEVLSEVPEDPEEGSFSFWKKGYVSGDVRYFLLHASQHIRERVFEELREIDPDTARPLRRLLYRDIDVVESEARTAFEEAVGLAELVTQFRAFIAPLACLQQALNLPPADSDAAALTQFLSDLIQFTKQAFADAITRDELRFVKQSVEALNTASAYSVAGALDFFSDRLQEEIDLNRDNGHCHFQAPTAACPACNCESVSLTWEIINVKDRPDLKAKAKSGQCLTETCAICGARRERSLPLFYCDPASNLYLLLCPDLTDEAESQLQDATGSYLTSLPSEFRGEQRSIAYASHFVEKWSSADDTIIVSRVRTPQEFAAIFRL